MIYVCPECDRGVPPIHLADGGWECSRCGTKYAKPAARVDDLFLKAQRASSTLVGEMVEPGQVTTLQRELAEARAQVEKLNYERGLAIRVGTDRGKEVLALREALRLVAEHDSVMARLEPDAHDALVSALTSTSDTAAAIVERIEAAAFEQAFSSLSGRLNDVLCEMEPDYDDSIVGFNEAWDVMRQFFKERALSPSPPALNAEERKGGA